MGYSDFTGADLGGCNFQGATADHTIFDSADASTLAPYVTRFQGADLRHASFHDAKINNANFDNSDLRAADLRVASMVGASFKGACYDVATQWPSGVDATTLGASLSKVDVEQSIAISVDASDCATSRE